jgi:spoIIIJ-associated protein
MDLKAFVHELLDKLGIAPESLTVSDGHRTVVRITTPDGALIGPHGEHLSALNTVARRLAEARGGTEASNFLIDINDYHEEQLEGVRAKARMLAQRARLFKHDVELPPQSAYERLVVHELFAEDPEIATQSAGEGKFRHVVLKYKNATA